MRTPHAETLTAALLAAGHAAARVGPDEVHVDGAKSDALGLVAAHEGVAITGLSERRESQFEALAQAALSYVDEPA